MSGFGKTVYVHASAVCMGEVSVGEYSSLWPCCSMRGDFAPITIGRFTSIQDCCALHAAPGAPLIIGDFVTVAHGAILHGCVIEDACVISMGAIVQDRAVVGKGSIVGAGAVIPEGRKIPPGSVALGVPAREKPGRPGQEEWILGNALSYAALAQAYLEGHQTIAADEVLRRMEDLKRGLRFGV